jgi:hypothetical protein
MAKNKKDSSHQSRGNTVTISRSTVHAPVAGHQVIQNSTVVQDVGAGAQVNVAGAGAEMVTVSGLTAAELAQVQSLVNALKDAVEAQGLPDDEKTEAKIMADRVEKELTAKDRKPDGGKLKAAALWLLEYGGKIAGAVTSIFVSPIVGKVVEAAGDLAAGWVKDQFGGTKPAALGSK